MKTCYVYQGSELIPFLRLPLLDLESQNGFQNKKMDNYLENGEHCLSYIKCMPPVVVHHRPVVFLHC